MTDPAQHSPSTQSQLMLEALQRAVTQALDRKKRLGQYAVIWRDGKPALIGDDAPADHQSS